MCRLWIRSMRAVSWLGQMEVLTYRQRKIMPRKLGSEKAVPSFS